MQQKTTVFAGDSRVAKNSAEKPKRGILSQLSMPAVLAAVLTSITSFVFSSRLGLTGSLIGAALAAAVSTIASQVYNGMIKTSADLIAEVIEPKTVDEEEHEETQELHAIEKTQIRKAPVSLIELEANEGLVASGTPVAPAALRKEAARREARAMRQRSFGVAVAVGLAALLAYGVVVHFATNGKGIGPTSFEEVEQPTEAKDPVASQQAPQEQATGVSVKQTGQTERGATDTQPVEVVPTQDDQQPEEKDIQNDQQTQNENADQPADGQVEEQPAPSEPDASSSETTETDSPATAPEGEPAAEPSV